MRGRCWVEIGPNKEPVRIFRSRAAAVTFPVNEPNYIADWPRYDAVHSIRVQVYERADWLCERCGKLVTFKTGEMDEKVSRGEGGEISLQNCWLLCYDCHQGHTFSEHGERRWGGQK